MLLSERLKVKLLRDCLELPVQLLVEAFILDGSFIQLLLDPLLPDGFVRNIVQLRDENIADRRGRVCLHHSVNVLDLLLELNDLVHKSLPDLAVLDLHCLLREAINLHVKLLERFVRVLSLSCSLLLQGLDKVEDLLVGQLDLCIEEHLR